MKRARVLGPTSLLLFLSLPSCGREEPRDTGKDDAKAGVPSQADAPGPAGGAAQAGDPAQAASGARASVLSAPAFHGEDVLARWAERFARVPVSAYDAPLAPLGDERRTGLVDKWATATSSSRRMARFAASAREDLLQDPAAALAALPAFLELPSNAADDELRALSLLAGYDAPEMVGFCLRHLTDPERLVRLWCVRRLGELDAPHAVPRLLVRIREFYEEDPEVLAAVYVTLAIHGNLAGLSHLLAWVGDPAWVDHAGPALIRIVGLCGTPYDESEGWDGLLAKARVHERRWRETGIADRPAAVVPAGVPGAGGQEAGQGGGAPDQEGNGAARHDSDGASGQEANGAAGRGDDGAASSQERAYILQREWWLLLRNFDEFQLRPVDEARFAAHEGGVAAVDLLTEALHDQRVNVRMPALEALLALGVPGRPCAEAVAALFGDRLCRATALNVYGAIHAPDALEVLSEVVTEAPLDWTTPAPGKPSREVLIAALHGLAELGPDQVALVALLQQRLAGVGDDPELRAWYLAALLGATRGLRGGLESELQRMLDEKRFHEPTLLEIRRKYR